MLQVAGATAVAATAVKVFFDIINNKIITVLLLCYCSCCCCCCRFTNKKQFNMRRREMHQKKFIIYVM